MNLWYKFQRASALLLLISLLPLLAVLWLLVKATSRGPFLYSQLRPGMEGKPIRTWKIRTMRPGADRNSDLARCVTQDCPEVTSIGKVLRQLKLDELPQLWNIVMGEMAFVGPRPIATSLYNELCERIEGFEERTSVRPGLSNVAQVAIDENGEGENLLKDWKERFEAEKHYLRLRSVPYDLIVICLTLLYIGRKSVRLICSKTKSLANLIRSCLAAPQFQRETSTRNASSYSKSCS
ncbi:MAG: sugar transferase [Aureliella sp.]